MISRGDRWIDSGQRFHDFRLSDKQPVRSVDRLKQLLACVGQKFGAVERVRGDDQATKDERSLTRGGRRIAEVRSKQHSSFSAPKSLSVSHVGMEIRREWRGLLRAEGVLPALPQEQCGGEKA